MFSDVKAHDKKRRETEMGCYRVLMFSFVLFFICDIHILISADMIHVVCHESQLKVKSETHLFFIFFLTCIENEIQFKVGFHVNKLIDLKILIQLDSKCLDHIGFEIEFSIRGLVFEVQK